MKKEQWTVIGLLVLLAALEIARNAGIASFLNNWFTGFQSALNNASNVVPNVPGLPLSPNKTPTPNTPAGGPVGSNIKKYAVMPTSFPAPTGLKVGHQ